MKNLIQAAAVTLFAASAAHAQQAVQWKVSDGGNGHWYAVDFAFRLWASAESYARSIGGHLATTTSQSELDFIRPFITNAFGADYWLGASRQTTASPWIWVTAEPFTFTRWEPGAPDNGPESLCLEVIGRPESAGFGMWNDEAFYAWGPGNYSVVEWSADCNNDGVVDYGQCLDGTLSDYNGNNIPDCCESGTPCVVGNYPVEWRVADGGNGHWYQFDPIVRDWASAMQAATAIGGHGVTVHSDEENNLAFGLSVPCCNAVWIGGRAAPDSCTDPTAYYWLTGEPMTFTDWLAGEPNGWEPPPESGCALSFFPLISTPEWNDVPIDPAWLGPSIIEWSADCNDDGIVDKGQILRGQLPDTNSNGILDGCECAASPTLPACCVGDLNQDSAVDGADLGTLLNSWGACPGTCAADIDRNGFVDGADLGVLLGRWGPCGN